MGTGVGETTMKSRNIQKVRLAGLCEGQDSIVCTLDERVDSITDETQ